MSEANEEDVPKLCVTISYQALQISVSITREYDCIRYSALGRLFSRFSAN